MPVALLIVNLGAPFRIRAGTDIDAQHLLDDPDVVIQGERVLHLRYRVRRHTPQM